MNDKQMNAARKRAVNWYFQDTWGWPPEDIPVAKGDSMFLKAQLIAANGDGTLAPEERQWVLGLAAAIGYPEERLQALEDYKADEDIAEVISSNESANKSSKAVIYYAIKACAADGVYHDEEKKVIRKAATAMGISEDVVVEIEKLCAEEALLKEKRIQLLFPDGSPVR